MDDFQKKLYQLQAEVSLPEIDSQVREIKKIIATLVNQQVLNVAPAKLGFEPDILETLLKKRPQDKKSILIINNMLNNFRSYLSRKFGLWSLANLSTVRAIQESYHFQTGLELMAGNAYWSKAFSEMGVKMIATDSFEWAKSSSTGNKPFFPTKNYEATQAIKKYANVDLIICCWAPNFGKGDQQILNTYRKCCSSKTKLLFIGEKNGATNTFAFWKEAVEVNSKVIKRINSTFSSFDFIEEKIYEIK